MLSCSYGSDIVQCSKDRSKKQQEAARIDKFFMRLHNDPAKGETDIRVLLLLARSGMPFTTVDLPEWKEMVAHMNRSTRSGEHLRSTVLPAVGSAVEDLVHTRLHRAPA
jgi:hypothetical protein